MNKAPLSWTPRKRGPIYCSPACGFNCTHDAHLKAKRKAKSLADKLGPEWKPDAFENMGWHYAARRGKCNVHPVIVRGKLLGYHALCGMFASEIHRDPVKAVREVRLSAKTYIEELAASIGGIVVDVKLGDLFIKLKKEKR